MTTPRWPVGVFASIDAGLGVHLEVAKELRVPTIQVHAPHAETRTPAAAQAFLARCKAAGITITAVFGGFEGESYADIATTARTVGLVPRETRAARLKEMKEISDFTKLLGCPTVALHIGFVPHDTSSTTILTCSPPPANCSITSAPTASNSTWKPVRNPLIICCNSSAMCSGTTCSSTSTPPT